MTDEDHLAGAEPQPSDPDAVDLAAHMTETQHEQR